MALLSFHNKLSLSNIYPCCMFGIPGFKNKFCTPANLTEAFRIFPQFLEA